MNRFVKALLLPSFALMLCILAMSVSLSAQNNAGSIVGTVKDQANALVPNAKVTITNNANGRSRDVTSNSDGNFAVTNLEPGNYKVVVSASGFKPVSLSSVTVETNARVPLSVVFSELEGTGENVVNISVDSAPLIETETSVRGDVITGREITDLPVGQRNFTVLAGLSPGVTRPIGSSFGLLGGGNEANPPNFPSAETARFRESGGSAISSNGARVTQNEFLIDGVDNNEAQFRQIALFPNPDAIAEFKIETSVPPAELGRAGGAIISTTLKSGGNRIHGSAFDFYQGRFLSAASGQFDEFNNPNGSRGVPNYVSHNFGGTIGGPIFFPRPGTNGKDPYFYNGRDRTFFFLSYAGQRGFIPAVEQDGSFVNRIPVPTALMRQGNFIELLQPGTTQTYNLAGGGTVVAPIGTIFAPNGTPIPGNNLNNCPTCGVRSNFATNYLAAFPLPTFNVPGENFTANRVIRPEQDVYDIRIDHRITDGGQLWGRYSKLRQERVVDNFFPLGASPTGNDLPAGPSAGNILGNTKAGVFGYTQTLSSNTVNDFRFGYHRVEIGILNTGVFGTGGFDPNISATLGAPNINIGRNYSGIVLLGIVDSIAGGDRAIEFTGDGGPFLFRSNNFNLADAVTVVKGNHIMKFGTDIRVRQNTNIDGGRNGGIKGNVQYGTSSRATNDNSGFANFAYNGIGPNDTGSSLANFLLGYSPGIVNRGVPGTDALLSSKEIAFFVQDDWKVAQNLTLNLGLRYDVFTAPTERHDRISNFDPATGLLTTAGPNGAQGRNLANTDKNNFGPRIGFAYSFGENKQFVMRGGYGLVYSVDASGIPSLNLNPGNGGGNYGCQPINNPGGCPAGVVGRNLYDRGLPLPSEFFAQRGTSFLAPTGGTIIYNDPDRKDAMFHQYNLTFQYGFWKDWLAEAAYVGSTGRNLLIVQNIGNGGDQGAPGSREVNNINTVIASRYLGDFKYNALQTKLEKRFGEGFSIFSTYTFARATDNTPGGFCLSGGGQRNCGPDNPLNLDGDKGPSDTDIKHRVTFTNVFDLPVGKGRKYFSGMPTGLEMILGGWQFNNIVTLQSGPVYDVTLNGGRVDIIGDPTPTPTDIAQGRLLNRAAFQAQRTQVFASDTGCFNMDGSPNFNCPMFGNLGRNSFRGQFQEYWDSSLFKNFPFRFINEEAQLQLRISAFNVLNHRNGGRPNTNLGDNFGFSKDFNEQRRRQLEFGLRFVF